MRRTRFVALMFLAAVIAGLSTSSNGFSFFGPTTGNSVPRWKITLPTAGSTVIGPVNAVGTGPNGGAAIFGQFTQDNIDPTSVYDYELHLVYSTPVSNAATTIWSAIGRSTSGLSFASISPVGLTSTLEDGPPGSTDSPSEPVDVSTVVFALGGDSVSYIGVSPPAPPSSGGGSGPGIPPGSPRRPSP